MGLVLSVHDQVPLQACTVVAGPICMPVGVADQLPPLLKYATPALALAQEVPLLAPAAAGARKTAFAALAGKAKRSNRNPSRGLVPNAGAF